MVRARRRVFVLAVLAPPIVIAVVIGCVAVAGMVTSAHEREQAETNRRNAPSEFEICAVLAMRHHHEQAIELSETLLSGDSEDDEVRAYAEFIATAQEAEIDTMDSWLAAWEDVAAPVQTVDGHHSAAEPVTESTAPTESATDAESEAVCDAPAMSGMATSEQIAELESATGRAASLAYITLMTAHHQGAIDMARETLENSSNYYVLSSARHTVTEQSLEIEQLRQMAP